MVARETILVATTNPGKLREVRAILAGLAINLEGLSNMGSLPEAVENADSFEDNARLKAAHYAGLTGLWTLADDSGLEVDPLGGRPGIHSARYAGPECDSAANNAKLIEELAGVAHDARTARFRCVAVLATPQEMLAVAHGVWEGLIINNGRGANGFGYDPHFFVPDCNMTAAEMDPQEKNRISHRARAFLAIRKEIELLLDHGPGSDTI